MKIKNGISGWLSSRRSLRSGRRRDNARRAAFSMIELLVVVVIILILTGVVYRISSYVTQRAGRARAAYELELLHNALDEYYAVYGHYPPTSSTGFTDYRNVTGRNNYPGSWGYYEDMDEDGQYMPNLRGDEPDGLYFYLIGKFGGGGDPQYMASAAERAEYERRWKHFLAEIDTPTDYQLRDTSGINPEWEMGTMMYSNFYGTIRDPYGREWRYQAVGDENRPQAYRLYSDGPPGQNQPIGKDRWNE